MTRRPLVAFAAVVGCLVVVSTAGSATRADAPTVSVTQTIAGLDDRTGGGYEPPDVAVAAGSGFVVQMVNLAARVWTTPPGAKATQVQTVALGDFFGTDNDRLTDPRILYDAPSGRWFASISDIDTSSVVLAASRDSDPAGAWSTYAFAASGCPDQPRIGIADGIVVLAADVFSSCDAEAAPRFGGELWIVNKAELLAGAVNVDSTTYGPDRSFESLSPVQSLSPTGTEYVVSADIPSSNFVHLLTVDGIPPAEVRVRVVASSPIAPLTQPPPAQQPRTTGGGRQRAIATNDDRVLDSVWENGKLWLSANTGCVPVGDTTLRACARVLELATATGTVTWETDLGLAGAHLFFPAIRPDAAGNLVIVYGESSVAIQPELVAVARTPDGTFTAPVAIAQSASQYRGSRYGDYFGAARDPANPNVVWVTGEQGTAIAGARGWSTSIAAVQVGAPFAMPPAVSGSPAPAMRAQVELGRRGAAVRLSYKALADGVGVHERITVRAKTTVLFSAATAPGRRHRGQIYSVIWHPGATLHGTFAWCVTSIAADATQSAPSCSTVELR